MSEFEVHQVASGQTLSETSFRGSLRIAPHTRHLSSVPHAGSESDPPRARSVVGEGQTLRLEFESIRYFTGFRLSTPDSKVFEKKRKMVRRYFACCDFFDFWTRSFPMTGYSNVCTYVPLNVQVPASKSQLQVEGLFSQLCLMLASPSKAPHVAKSVLEPNCSQFDPASSPTKDGQAESRT